MQFSSSTVISFILNCPFWYLYAPLSRIKYVYNAIPNLTSWSVFCTPETQDRHPVRAVAPIYLDFAQIKSVFNEKVVFKTPVDVLS
jgi:hypothetical protein